MSEFKNASRSGLLTAFVIANLVFWILVAVAVGVLANDLVDLGIESFFRESGSALVSLGVAPPPSGDTAQAVAPGATAPQAALVEPVEPAEEGAGFKESGEGTLAPASPTQAWAEPEEPAGAGGNPAPSMEMTPYATRTPRAQSGAPTEAVPAEAVPAQPTIAPTQAPQNQAAGSSLPSPALEADPLVLVDPDVDRLNRLDAEIRQSAVGRPFEIQMAEDALNEQLAVALARYGGLPYTGVSADLKPGQVVLSGKVRVIGMELPAEVRGTVVAVGCRPAVQIDSVTVGGILTPKFVKQQVVQLVEDSLDWYPADYPLCIEQIVIEENRAILYGSRR